MFANRLIGVVIISEFWCSTYLYCLYFLCEIGNCGCDDRKFCIKQFIKKLNNQEINNFILVVFF